MNSYKNRKYVSPSREQQALATKNRMLDAAEALLIEKGFAGMTVADVARKAEVSQQTVYAVFNSKAGIITAAIEDRVMRDDRYADTIKQLHATDNPALILRSMAKLIRNIYEGNAPTFTAVYGARFVSPQLAELESELGELRLAKQKPILDNLVAGGRLLPGLSEKEAQDILWACTAREVYYLLVVRRGWTPERYEKYLADTLIISLLSPEACPKTPDSR